jgi:hypothetical protein
MWDSIDFSYISGQVGVCDGDPESLLKGLNLSRSGPFANVFDVLINKVNYN